ncbi:MAG: serine protease [Synechococcaceae cyanobacterium SM2_3_1]|nr:serine protease [Synechococcaceae cyanobacterium SM2_3_1]
MTIGLIHSCGGESMTTTSVPSPDTNLIVGGTPANINNFPWLARLDLEGRVCSGTLIEKDMILTAGHCVEGINPSNSKAIFGQTDTREGVLTGQIVKTRKFTIFPGYTQENPRGPDIALIQLERSIDRPTFPWNDDQTTDLSGQSATVVGWGATQVVTTAPIRASLEQLNQGTVTILSDEACVDQFTTGPINIERTICAFDIDTSSCFGDSGGPLISTISGQAKVLGITSWTQGNFCRTFPVAFTEVSFFSNWINAQLAQRIIPDSRPDLTLGVIVSDQITGQEPFKEYNFIWGGDADRFLQSRFIGVQISNSQIVSKIEVLNADNQLIREGKPLVLNPLNSRLFFVARANQEYTIRISSNTRQETGTFQLTLF